MQELSEARGRLVQLEAAMADLDQQLARVRKTAKTYGEIKARLELKQHEYNLAEARIAQSTCHQVCPLR